MLVPIVFACDNGYAMPTGVAIVSLIRNKKPETRYAIHVLGNDLSAEHRAQLLSLTCDGVTVEVVDVRDKYRAHIAQTTYVTTTTLFRYDLADLFPAYDRLIYLDGDIIVQDDLSAMYETDLDGKYLAAPEVYRVPFVGSGKSEFYAGTFVCNCKRWRDEGIAKILLERTFALNSGPNDMMAMNDLLSDKVKHISPTWDYCNVNDMLCATSEAAKQYSLTEAEWLTVRRRPAILHYIDGKPWDFYFCLRASLWRQYYRLSPYAGQKLNYKWSNKLFAVWLFDAVLPFGRGRVTLRWLYFKIRRRG